MGGPACLLYIHGTKRTVDGLPFWITGKIQNRVLVSLTEALAIRDQLISFLRKAKSWWFIFVNAILWNRRNIFFKIYREEN